MQLGPAPSILLGSSSGVLHAVDAMVVFQELVVAALKVAVMMDREELMGLPKVD